MSLSTLRHPDPAPMVWHGWGDPSRRTGLPDHVRELLEDRIGPLPAAPTPPVPLSDVQVPASRLTSEQRATLTEVVGDGHLADDHGTRVRHAAGRSYPDLVRLRRGELDGAPDAVVAPASHAEVAALLTVCAAHRLAVVPVGGGTSVVGGLVPERGHLDAVVALDLSRMAGLTALDEVSGIATFGPGTRGADAEAALRERGFSLGHFPQSFEYGRLGGFVATRSAGQASTGHGRIDDRVVAVRCATPAGDLEVGHPTPTAAGPDLRGLVVGSEGVFGVLTELELRVHAAPDVEHHETFATPSFASGAATVRALVQAGVAPDVVRLSDESESEVALAELGGWQATTLDRYLRIRGTSRPALLLLGWEGDATRVTERRRAAHRILSRRRLVSLGAGPGRSWARHRFDGPYLRDDLLDHGVMVDTLETSTSWAGLGALYLATRAAISTSLAERGTPPVVLCHVSHAYPTGASLYFTWLARQEQGVELDQWRAVKHAASDAIVGAGGTITHHHAVGIDHRDRMDAEVGPLGLEVLRTVKARLDPDGILNPGKLLPPA